MQTIEQHLPGLRFFTGMDSSTIALMAGCAVNVHFDVGDRLFRTGESADRFYVVRKGRVAIEVHAPAGVGEGRPAGPGGIVIDTADDGDAVGWSWLVPPYRWMFDARAVTATSAVAFDAACLRRKCAADPALGYALMQRVAEVMYHGLQGARIRLLDVYGAPRERKR